MLDLDSLFGLFRLLPETRSWARLIERGQGRFVPLNSWSASTVQDVRVMGSSALVCQ